MVAVEQEAAMEGAEGFWQLFKHVAVIKTVRDLHDTGKFVAWLTTRFHFAIV